MCQIKSNNDCIFIPKQNDIISLFTQKGKQHLRLLYLILFVFSLSLCAKEQVLTTKTPKNPNTPSPTKSSKESQEEKSSNPLLSQTSSSLARWFIGVSAGANYSLKYEKPFAMVDFKTGLTYDNQWGRSYIYANISYAYLKDWNTQAHSSDGYFIDTLFNTDLGVNLVETPSFSFLLMFGVGIGGRWIEQGYTLEKSFYTHESFFISNLNISMRAEIAKEHVISLTFKPQLTKGWYQDRELTFEYFKEMSLLLSYTFWKF